MDTTMDNSFQLRYPSSPQLWNFILERAHSAPDDTIDMESEEFWRGFIAATGTEKSIRNLRRHFRNDLSPNLEEMDFDRETKKLLSKCLKIRVNDENQREELLICSSSGDDDDFSIRRSRCAARKRVLGPDSSDEERENAKRAMIEEEPKHDSEDDVIVLSSDGEEAPEVEEYREKEEEQENEQDVVEEIIENADEEVLEKEVQIVAPPELPEHNEQEEREDVDPVWVSGNATAESVRLVKPEPPEVFWPKYFQQIGPPQELQQQPQQSEEVEMVPRVLIKREPVMEPARIVNESVADSTRGWSMDEFFTSLKNVIIESMSELVYSIRDGDPTSARHPGSRYSSAIASNQPGPSSRPDKNDSSPNERIKVKKFVAELKRVLGGIDCPGLDPLRHKMDVVIQNAQNKEVSLERLRRAFETAVAILSG
ncbi:unnamed protein product [Caenorhabditis sp. 36 PRJEB53466]|nr:unnamed protein product [Caenorhabditis sp. 36 PRJEB53466]